MKTEDALRERAKELKCLQQIEQIAGNDQGHLSDILQKCAEVLPGAWLHSESAVAVICFDDKVYQTGDLDICKSIQTSEIKVNDRLCGLIKIGYTRVFAEADEGPFLAEKRVLIDMIASRIGHIVESKRDREMLRLSETRYRMAQEMGHVGHWIYDPRIRTFEASPEALRIYGFDAGAKPSFDEVAARIAKTDAERAVSSLLNLFNETGRQVRAGENSAKSSG